MATVPTGPRPVIDVEGLAAFARRFEQQIADLESELQELTQPLSDSGSSSPDSGSSSLEVEEVHSPRILSYLPATPKSLQGTPDVDVPGSEAILTQDEISAVTDRAPAKLAAPIMDIIQKYGKNISSKESPWPGRAKFLPLVESYIMKNEPVQMVLPAFPFKSPNRKDKTLGSLPDLGEELALMHLNGLCESIAELYKHGANVVITSDGLVYNGTLPFVDAQQKTRTQSNQI